MTLPLPKREFWKSRWWRLFPIYAAPDWRGAHPRHTRDYVGTGFGGSIYGVADLIYGRGYIVRDKAARIRFQKPGRTTPFALSEAELQTREPFRRPGLPGGAVHAEIKEL